jgi:hypothetical protein
MKAKTKLLGLIFIYFLMYGDVKAQSLYHQLGVDSSSADKTNFNNSQGVATQILGKKSQTFSGGGAHYFWVATGIKEPTGTVFSQMGYHISCNNCGMRPFIFTSGASIPASNIFVVYNYFLPDNQYSTFWYETNGVQNADGTYNWDFWFWYPGINDTKLTTLKFKTKNCTAPYAVSEVAGSRSPCNDAFNITYGNGTSNNYALFVRKNGIWNFIQHAISGYSYVNCTSTNVAGLGFQRFRTVIPQTRSTCSSYSCSNCNNDPNCVVCGGCQVW